MGRFFVRQRAMGIGITLVAVCATGVRAQAAVAETIPCRPAPGTTTIAHSKHARIFEDGRNENDYACLYSNGHPHLLSPSEHYGYPIVRFAGPYVAYVPTTRSAPEGDVWVMDLRTGHKHGYVAVQPVENDVRVHDRHGLRVLESAPGIAPTSLRLSHSELSWVNGVSTHTATLY
jgi:hypothetical protein